MYIIDRAFSGAERGRVGELTPWLSERRPVTFRVPVTSSGQELCSELFGNISISAQVKGILLSATNRVEL